MWSLHKALAAKCMMAKGIDISSLDHVQIAIAAGIYDNIFAGKNCVNQHFWGRVDS
jgi:hypothetical protein